MARVKGNVKPIFTLKIGAATAVDLSNDLKSVSLSNEDKDDSDLTFAELAGGTGVDWILNVTAKISYGDAGSLHDFLWANAGQDAVFVYGSGGNASPSTTKPHYTGTVRIPRKPGVEVEASATGEAEFEYEFSGQSDVEKLTA